MIWWQIQIRVRDQSNPEKTSDAKVKVTIERDQKTPKFTHQPYTVSIQEDITVNRALDVKPARVQAKDEDKKVGTSIVTCCSASNSLVDIDYTSIVLALPRKEENNRNWENE